MKDLVDTAIASINIDNLCKEILQKAQSCTGKSSVTIKWKLNMDTIFTESFTDDKKALRVWFSIAGYDYNYTLYKDNYENQKHFYDYFYGTDPDIQRLRMYFRTAFPDAKITPFLFVHWRRESELSIEITHSAPLPSKITNIDDVKLRIYTIADGNFVQW
jgi:hypothetical protein